MKAACLLLISMILLQTAWGQQSTPQQDSTLNNLVHPEGYKSCALGDLGAVTKVGSGKRSIILVAGLGFGSDAYQPLTEHLKKEYTVYVVTPAGFDGTPAPPMPDSGIPYSQMTWTVGIETGILKLIEREQLDRPIILGAFVTGTQVALDLALDHPEKIGRAVIAGGSPYRYYPSQKEDGSWSDWTHELIYTAADRSRVIEKFWAPKWFKTVTKKTWDDNMWTPDDYCKDSAVGHALFRESATNPLPVMIRYLIEWMAYDVNDRYQQLTVPCLVLIPDFSGLLPAGGAVPDSACSKLYLKYFHQTPWDKAKQSGNPKMRLQEIPGTRIFMWQDNPGGVFEAIQQFLDES